jgi:hypothetical protein
MVLAACLKNFGLGVYFVYPSIILTCIMREHQEDGVPSLMSKRKKSFLGFWTDICPLQSFDPVGLTLYRDY